MIEITQHAYWTIGKELSDPGRKLHLRHQSSLVGPSIVVIDWDIPVCVLSRQGARFWAHESYLADMDIYLKAKDKA